MIIVEMPPAMEPNRRLCTKGLVKVLFEESSREKYKLLSELKILNVRV